MDFTREPIIETVITPKEGCKIVVRSSKSAGQEEYFVDSLEVVSFGSAIFFRSQEKPKAFLVPVTDYEVLEVREARMVLKNVGLDRSIKIGGGRENKPIKEVVAPVEKVEPIENEQAPIANADETANDNRADKKRDKRRQQRRRRGRDEIQKDESGNITPVILPPLSLDSADSESDNKSEDKPLVQAITPLPFSSMLPPPPTLISETIGRYKENVLFKNAFYNKEESISSANHENEDHVIEKAENTEDLEANQHEIEPIKENDENLLIENFEESDVEKYDSKSNSEEYIDAHKPFSITSEGPSTSNFSFWGDVNEPTLFPPFEKKDSDEETVDEGDK